MKKNLVLLLLVFLGLFNNSCSSSVDEPVSFSEQNVTHLYPKSDVPPFPYGCREWTIGIGILSTTVKLCCWPANYTIPPANCTERLTPVSSSLVSSQFVSVSDIELGIGRLITDSTIQINENIYTDDESGQQYKLLGNNYLIQTNTMGERYIEIFFERI